MTSVSQPAHTSTSSASNNSNASQSAAQSYASATKKAVSSPPVAASSSSQSPAVAVGNAPPAQHGKSSSVSPVNGRSSVPPAAPVVSTPAVLNGSAPEHGRQSSVTINGNYASPGASKAPIQFGSMAEHSAAPQGAPQDAQATPSAPIAIPSNPRATSPAQSPSPIPQPAASGGGRPPTGFQNTGMTFGSLGGDGDRHMRQASAPQVPLGQQPVHDRRLSGEGAMNPSRGGFAPQGGRGRGYNNAYQNQQMGYPQNNHQFRGQPGQGRGGMPGPFPGQGRPMPPYNPNSPHQAARSPALANSVPNTPNLGQQIPMQPQQQYGGYAQPYMAPQNFGYAANPYDRMSMMGQPNPYMYTNPMQYVPGAIPPQSPQPGYQQPFMAAGQYPPPQPQPMSRTPSQNIERPTSGMGQPPAPVAPVPATPQKAAAPTASAFQRTVRKNAAITIKRPDGGDVKLPDNKAPASPAPSTQSSKTPPVVVSTPTPPPNVAPQHARTDSKRDESVLKEFKQKILASVESKEEAKNSEAKSSDAKPAAEAAKPEAPKPEAEKPEAEKPAAEKPEVKEPAKTEKAEEKPEAKAEKPEEKAEKPEEKAEKPEEKKETSETDAAAAAAKAKQDEEDELDRQIAEMEEAEAAREKAEAEVLAKRAEAKAKAEKEEAEKSKGDAEANDQKLRDQEREMERIEDEREKKRQEADAKAAGVETKPEPTPAPAEAPATASSLASKFADLKLGERGAAPAAGDMGPPPKGVSADKRGKPAALNLAQLNTKPVEPPQPSAALKSLKSAKFINSLEKSAYPANISSPNPALNPAATGKENSLKYDKEFLLQFQKVFTEKPSTDFETQIKSLIGDGDAGSSRAGSNRTPSGMGPRQGSNRGGVGQFTMGTFAKAPLPPGTTSQQRFEMSQGTLPRPSNPMSNFRPSTGFPGGMPSSRQPSGMGMPQSPRVANQSRGGRQGSKRDTGRESKQTAEAEKKMPLTSGANLKPIEVTSSGWKPRSVMAQAAATGAAGPTPGGPGGVSAGYMDPETVQRKVKAALNKMTPEKFDRIADQILVIVAQSKDEQDGRTLRQVIQLTFEKATDEAHWASMYAKFCKRMLETMSPEIRDESIFDKNGNVVSGGNLFRKYLLNRCQEEFERGWKTDLPQKPEGERGQEKTEEAAMMSDEYYVAAAAKRRGLGLVQFIGELYKLGMLTERIMHECVKKLVDYTGVPDEAEIESLTKLLKTIGGNLDNTEKGRPMMDMYFSRIQTMMEIPDLPSRLRYMLMDIIDLRKQRWVSKEMNKGPKTLEEIRAEAEAAAQKTAENNARGPRGGGGRMPMGRGDSRSFSNQYGNQPPVDYTKNTVATDDLRRLNRGPSRAASGAPMSFGPTSMFSSRSNSGRKMGPGGSLSRTGEDSGASSRTGTPPQQKEKEPVATVNAYNLLRDLHEQEHNEHSSSPPKNASPDTKASAPPPAGEKKE